MNGYTFFCRDVSGHGTTHVEHINLNDIDEARKAAIASCADDWGTDESLIAVVGVARGDVEIIEWDDEA